MALRESALNGYSPTGKSSRLRSLEKDEIFEGGEREADLLVHALWTNSPLSFLVFFSFFSVFVLIFFLFPLALFFSFHLVRYPLFFDPFYRAQQGPLYSACRDQCFIVFPLNRLCLVWVYLPIVQNPCQTEADSFCPSVCRRLISSFCAPRPFLPRC